MLHLGRRVSIRAPPASSLRRAIVLDLDETLLWRPRGAIDAVALYCGYPVGEVYPGALQALAELSRSWSLIAVTARWSVAEQGTADWLEAHGLGHVPVIYASHARPRDASRVAFKAAAVERYRAEGWDPVLGIGDRPSDLDAYAAVGLPALMVAHVHSGHAADTLRALRLGAGARGSVSGVRCVTDDPIVLARPDVLGLADGVLHIPSIAPGTLVPPVWTQIIQGDLVRALVDRSAPSPPPPIILSSGG